jgi:hypothetical protein
MNANLDIIICIKKYLQPCKSLFPVFIFMTFAAVFTIKFIKR